MFIIRLIPNWSNTFEAFLMVKKLSDSHWIIINNLKHKNISISLSFEKRKNYSWLPEQWIQILIQDFAILQKSGMNYFQIPFSKAAKFWICRQT